MDICLAVLCTSVGVTGLLPHLNGSVFLFAHDIHVFAQSDVIEIRGTSL